MSGASSSSSSSSAGGIGFAGALTILFVALKLIPSGHGHIIDWPWIWVLSPLWISTAIVLVAIIVMLIVLFINEK